MYNYKVATEVSENNNSRLYTTNYRSNWSKSNVNLQGLKKQKNRYDSDSSDEEETIAHCKSNVNLQDDININEPVNVTSNLNAPYGELKESVRDEGAIEISDEVREMINGMGNLLHQMLSRIMLLEQNQIKNQKTPGGTSPNVIEGQNENTTISNDELDKQLHSYLV